MGAIIKRPISNAVYLMPERPEGDFSGIPWDRAQQFPLTDIAGDLPLVDFALQFTLAHPDVSTAIIGTTNVDHLRANASIAGTLDDDVIAKAKTAWRELFG